MSQKILDNLNFDNIDISTKTIIVSTNITLNIDKLYNNLPITKYPR